MIFINDDGVTGSMQGDPAGDNGTLADDDDGGCRGCGGRVDSG